MVHRVLEIARITSSDLQRERHMFDVKAIIMEHVERIRAKAFARGVTVSFQAAPQPLIVNSSEHEIQLALTELLDNALKFNRDYGHIAVAAGCANGEVTIRIADTGTGMEKSTAENALGVFFADDKEPLHSRGNIGLGLTLVALFAQSNQGRLAIESERDVGTAIMLSLASAAEDYVLLSA
jgi:two-component system phosphate regulon sensor histidine kinase PhoR